MAEARATMKYVRTSPMKMRRAIDRVRGQHVDEAAHQTPFLGIEHDDLVELRQPRSHRLDVQIEVA